MADGIYNTGYTGLKWGNIDKYLKMHSEYNLIVDACNHNQMINDQIIENHFHMCNIIRNQSRKYTLRHPREMGTL